MKSKSIYERRQGSPALPDWACNYTELLDFGDIKDHAGEPV
ncbi:hypothetical protein [Thalassoglobus sp.]